MINTFNIVRQSLAVLLLSTVLFGCSANPHLAAKLLHARPSPVALPESTQPLPEVAAAMDDLAPGGPGIAAAVAAFTPTNTDPAIHVYKGIPVVADTQGLDVQVFGNIGYSVGYSNIR